MSLVMKVLVLDDHKGFRDEVLNMLTHNGHEGIGEGRGCDSSRGKWRVRFRPG
jgi:hypothetical protein